jgi:hypothetical protein
MYIKDSGSVIDAAAGIFPAIRIARPGMEIKP